MVDDIKDGAVADPTTRIVYHVGAPHTRVRYYYDRKSSTAKPYLNIQFQIFLFFLLVEDLMESSEQSNFKYRK